MVAMVAKAVAVRRGGTQQDAIDDRSSLEEPEDLYLRLAFSRRT